MPIETMEELFEVALQEIYYAERDILVSLPKMARAAQSLILKEAMEKHLEQTRGQVARLEQVFAVCGIEPKMAPSLSYQGISQEGEKLMMQITDAPTLQAALIGAAQSVEHFEIAKYGTLCAWADALGMTEAIELLQANLEEEKETDKILTSIALGEVNEDAAGDSEVMEDEAADSAATVSDAGIVKNAQQATGYEAAGAPPSSTNATKRAVQERKS